MKTLAFLTAFLLCAPAQAETISETVKRLKQQAQELADLNAQHEQAERDRKVDEMLRDWNSIERAVSE